MKAAIICIGNRFVAADAAGPAVYERLREMDKLPDDLDIVEGGLQGLNLLPLLERGGRVVFVDAVSGFAEPGHIVLLNQEQIRASAGSDHFGHDAGLAYLLAILPAVCEGTMPEEIVLVGIEGACSPHLVEQAAQASLTIAQHGLQAD